MEQNNRCADTNQPQTTQTHSPNQNKSHVLAYILILFIAAFLMMALSFLSHQHTNEQVLGQLKTNVSSLSRLQSALEENMQLQEQLDAQKIQLEELQKGLSASQESQSKLSEQLTELEKEQSQLEQTVRELQNAVTAMDALTQLQQKLIAGDLIACRKIIADMESTGLDKLLPDMSYAPGGVSPQQMYQQIKLMTAVSSEE